MQKLKKFFTRKKIILIISAVIALILIAGFVFYSHQKTTKISATPNEAADLSAKVGKLIELPSEIPTVATVSDLSSLKKQQFFAHAQKGDKVLIYPKANKAILYRPSINKLIEVAFYNPSGATVIPSAASQKVKVAIYNGTGTASLAKSEGASLSAKYPDLQIVVTANASSDYASNLVVDLSGNNSQTAESLAKDLSGEVGDLPTSETKPANSDILVILGSVQ